MKFLAALVFFGILSASEACAPGTGTLGKVATLDYEFSPAIMYTYSSGSPELGQIDQGFAERTVKSDVKNAINEVLQANSIPLNDINPPVVTYTAREATIALNIQTCKDAPVNSTIAIDGRIAYFCKDVNGVSTNDNFLVPLSVQITAVQQIYQSQWEAMASQVKEKVAAKRKSVFYDDAVVTVSN